MKKILFGMMMLLMATVSVNAQIAKGTKSIAANFNSFDMSVAVDEKVDNYNLGVGLSGKYFFADNLSVVGGLTYDLMSIDSKSTNTIGYTIGIQPYFWQNCFVGARYEGLTSNNAKDYHNALRFDIGICHYLTDKLFLEPSVYFRQGLGSFGEDLSRIGVGVVIGIDLP